MIAIIVQARMGSTRLPGKVLERAAGKSLLAHLLERLHAQGLGEVIVATTTATADAAIAVEAKRLGVRVHRGSEADVLDRYVAAASEVGAEVVVRITADCPLMDPALVAENLALFGAGELDYVSNSLEPGIPRGMNVEVCSFEALARAHREAAQPYHREHVTPYLYEQPGRFKTCSNRFPTDLSHHRWTVDTYEDLVLVRRLLAHLYQPSRLFTMADVLGLLAQHPSWSEINAHVEQKSFRAVG